MKIIIILILTIIALLVILFGVIHSSLKERKEKNTKIRCLENKNIGLEKILEEYKKKEIEYEELKNKAHSGASADSFNASIELLQKQTESGRKRNK